MDSTQAAIIAAVNFLNIGLVVVYLLHFNTGYRRNLFAPVLTIPLEVYHTGPILEAVI
jgi:hypothetical protein